MRKLVGLIAVVALGLVGWWLAGRGQAPSPEASDAGAVVTAAAVDRTPTREPATGPRPPASLEPATKRKAMRRRILEALAARDRAARDAAAGSTGSEPGPDSPPRPRPSEADDDAPPVGNLVDRTGNHGYLVKVMNEDLMPLADECYELAREHNPALQGMLIMELEIIGEQDIGGVVESVGPGRDNELDDPTLVECVRESILATTLPPPEHGGRDQVMLSMPLSPDLEH